MKKTIHYHIIFLTFLLMAMQHMQAQTPSWVKKTDFINGPSTSAWAFTINDTIYVGNTGGTGLYTYDYITNHWAQKNDVPAALNNRTASVAFVINGMGYVMGGVGNGGLCAADLWQYNPATDSWAQKADYPGGKRAWATAFVVGGNAYVAGGVDTFDLNGIINQTPENDFWKYDAGNDSWARKTNIPYDSSYLYAPSSFTLNGKGYLVCGSQVLHQNGFYQFIDSKSIYQYDTTADAWLPKADYLGDARCAGVAFPWQGHGCYGTGINDDHNIYYNDFYTYNDTTNVWDTLAATNVILNRVYAIAATVSTGKAFVGTGWDAGPNTYFQDWWELGAKNPSAMPNTVNNTIITCYPNPCTNMLRVQLQNTTSPATTYTLYNEAGARALQGALSATGIINTTALAPGSYTLQLNNNNQTYQKKIVKE